jgi:hypothetical protein
LSELPNGWHFAAKGPTKSVSGGQICGRILVAFDKKGYKDAKLLIESSFWSLSKMSELKIYTEQNPVHWIL